MEQLLQFVSLMTLLFLSTVLPWGNSTILLKESPKIIPLTRLVILILSSASAVLQMIFWMLESLISLIAVKSIACFCEASPQLPRCISHVKQILYLV